MAFNADNTLWQIGHQLHHCAVAKTDLVIVGQVTPQDALDVEH